MAEFLFLLFAAQGFFATVPFFGKGPHMRQVTSSGVFVFCQLNSWNASLGPLKYGEFALYPRHSDQYEAGMFSIDLKSTARNVFKVLDGSLIGAFSHGASYEIAKFLSLCHDRSLIWSTPVLETACATRYKVRRRNFRRLFAEYNIHALQSFLELQAKHLSKKIVPPLDVALVWFSHMLQSEGSSISHACESY